MRVTGVSYFKVTSLNEKNREGHFASALSLNFDIVYNWIMWWLNKYIINAIIIAFKSILLHFHIFYCVLVSSCKIVFVVFTVCTFLSYQLVSHLWRTLNCTNLEKKSYRNQGIDWSTLTYRIYFTDGYLLIKIINVFIALWWTGPIRNERFDAKCLFLWVPLNIHTFNTHFLCPPITLVYRLWSPEVFCVGLKLLAVTNPGGSFLEQWAGL